MRLKKILSLLLAMTMLFSCVGITAMAEGTPTTVTTAEELLEALGKDEDVTEIVLGGDIDLSDLVGEEEAYVAEVNGIGYETFEEALVAAQAGDTITLLSDATPALTSQRAITKAAVIDLNGNTLTLTEDDLYFGTTTFKNGNIIVDPSVKPSTAVFWMFKDQTLTFDNVKLTATGVIGTYLIGLDGSNADLNLLNGSEIIVDNETALDLDIICVNASTGNDIVIDDSKVSVTNLDGRVFFRGNYTVSGESEIYLDGITKAGFRIEAGQSLEIKDTAIVTVTGVPRDGGIHLTDLAAVYTKADTATVNATVNAPKKPAVAKIGDTGYASVSEALDAAYNAGMKDVVITLIGDTAANTTDSIDLYNNYGNGTAFNKVTISQEDASKPYYLKNLYTGWIGDKVVFDGVNIVVTTQFYAIGKVELTNNSTITRKNDTTNFVFYGDMYIEPGSKLESQVDRVSSGSSLTVDGGRTDGNHNNTADYKTVWLYVEDGNTMTIKNGAYVIVSNYEYAELEVSGTVDVQDSRLDVFTAIKIGENGVFKVDANSIINTARITGTGKIVIDAAGMSEGEVAALKNVNMSGFTGTIEVINNDYLEANIDENGNIVLTAVAKTYVAQINDEKYETLQAAAEAAKAGDTITMIADTTVTETITLPAGITFNGNGKSITGNIVAGGNLTFEGHTKVSNFDAGYDKPTITIGEGACLELTGSGRMVIGHGATFNITGSITDAKNANTADLTPSLIMPGASFTGAGVTFNVSNAYIKTTASYCSSSKSASGTFDFNIENSIWEQYGKLAFEAQSTAATVNFNLKDSVLTTSSHLVFGVADGNSVIDNSNVNVGNYRQLENRSNLTIKNGSVVYASVQVSSNANNPGTLIVDNATYIATGEFSGVNLGTGKLILKNGATATVPKFGNATVEIGAGCTLNTNYKTDGEFTITAESGYEVKFDNGVYTTVKGPVAKIDETSYATLEEAFKAATDGCTIEILDDVVIDYKWDCRDYATNGSHSQFKETVTINGNGHTLKFTGTVNDNNWNTIFRFEENATVNDLTIDISEATGAQRVISAKKSLNVDKLTIVGSAKYGIIFGEGADATDLAAAEITVTNSDLCGTRRAISDNEGGKDVKSVTITGNKLNANAYASAFESIIFSNNTATGEVDLRSYTKGNTLNVSATGNTLNTGKKNYIEAGGTVNAQDEFVLPWDGVTISNLDELKMFRDAVNAGDTYAGKTVTLTADIDLAGENWIPIGTVDNDHGFMGNFDGQNHKIINLTITNPELDGDGYAYAGLFGITEGIDKDNQNFIKNLTIENVTINTTGHIVAAAIAYPYYTIVDNVKVCGKISISGGDYTAGVLAYTRRCIDASNLSVEGDTGSTISGRQVVGGVISDIQMNGGLTANYSNFNVSGVTISGTKNVGGISGIISEQKLIGGSVKDVTLSCNDARVGIVSGSLGGASVISNVTIDNVTGASSIVGADYATGKVVEAKIGDKYYKTLADALKANVEGEITLLAPIVVNAGETLTLNKNVTITYTSNVPGEDMITNRGNIVIDGATLVYTNTDTTANNVTVSTISCEPGSTIEVKSGTVQNDSANKGAAGIYAYAIDLVTNGNLGDVTATISGGNVISTNYMAIRQFVNGEACKNTLTVAGGTIKGATRGINIQLKNNMAYTTISGGKIIGGDYSICFLTTSENVSVTGGEFEGDVWYSGTEGFISGGTFSVRPDDAYAAEGYEFTANEEGKYEVTEKAELFEFYGVSVVLGNSLELKFYIESEQFNGTDYYAKIVHSAETGDKEKIVDFNQWETSGIYKTFSYSGIAAKQMTDDVTVIIYDKNGNPVSVELVTSLEKYALGHLANYEAKKDKTQSDLNWMTAMVDMLNYGAAAQVNFGYKEETLANANVGIYQVYASENVALEKDLVSSGNAYATSVTFADKIVFNAYFENVTKDMYAKVEFTDHYGTNKNHEITYDKFVPNGKYHMVVVDKLVIADAAQNVKVTLCDKEGNVYGEISESVNGYLCRASEASPDKEIYPAMAKFSASAKKTLAKK